LKDSKIAEDNKRQEAMLKEGPSKVAELEGTSTSLNTSTDPMKIDKIELPRETDTPATKNIDPSHNYNLINSSTQQSYRI
jgi:hypothetical protein